MHMVITNAVNADPYSIDTLILFMANMAWNSTMNTSGVQDMLREKHSSGPNAGEHKIPFLVVVDTFESETVNFADLVLPDTTYLERHDTISLLDRPISEADTVADAIRHPQHVQRIMSELRALGCTFSLAGFSGDHMSLVVLEAVRPDFVKLEGSLASNMDQDLDIYTRVEMIFRKCLDMNIRTIAEHVEDRGALLKLREIGVNYAQGFFIGHPEPLV